MNTSRIKNYLFTLIFTGLSILFFILSDIYNFDVFEKGVVYLETLDHYEIDELILAAGTIITGGIIDLILFSKRLFYNQIEHKTSLQHVENLKNICDDLSQPLMALMNQFEMSKHLLSNEDDAQIDKQKVVERLEKVEELASRINQEISRIRISTNALTDKKDTDYQ